MILTQQPTSGVLRRAGRGIAGDVRPTGADYVRYEDLYVSGDTLQQTINRATGNRILTFPEGEFVFDQAFTNGYHDCIRIPTTCRGIAGSGDGTVFRFPAGLASAAKRTIGTDGIDGTNPLYLFFIDNVSNAYFGHFKLVGDPDPGLYYNGIGINNGPDSIFENLKLVGASPGFSNFPPGETFGIGINHCDRTTVRDCDVDGRDETGTRVCASPIGWNNSTDSFMVNGYYHHAKTGMVTWYKITNVTTYNVRSEYNGSGGGNQSGDAFNHERVAGIVQHNNPTLICDYNSAGGNRGLHMSMGSDESTATYTINEPVFDAAGLPNGGCYAVYFPKVYAGSPTTQMSMPTIIKNGVTLSMIDSSVSTTGANRNTTYVLYR